jgi:membrane protein required for colicin V production
VNWVDIVLVLLVLTSVIVGAKKGLVRESMAFLLFFASMLASVIYIDNVSIWLFDQLGGSPLVTAFLAFLLLLTISYTAFKLLGYVFYKVAHVKQLGKQDQMGGALIGFLRGWLGVGYLTFLVFLLPLPESFFNSFDQSFFGPVIARTMPMLYDGTSAIHPSSPDFMEKIEKALVDAPKQSTKGNKVDPEDREDVFKALNLMNRYFSATPEKRT